MSAARSRCSQLAIVLVVLIALSLAGCELLTGGASSTGGLQPTPPTHTSDWYQIYFTDPLSPGAASYRGGPDAALAEAIDRARLSVDVAIYDLNLWSIRDALLAADDRGISVRVVTESDNLDEPELNALKEAGIPVLGDRREGLMHNKFVIIDQADVWSGSMNFTVTDGYRNNNSLVFIRSSRLAEDFEAEFEEMFTKDVFGASSNDTPYPILNLDGTRLEVYFSPDDGTAQHILDWISSAQQSIDFMAYSFTSKEIASAMLERAQAGIAVRGIFEAAQYRTNIGTQFDRLRQAGLDVRLDGNPNNMHHKVIIIDQRVVIMGSYNFSNSAENRNDENTLIVSSADWAAQYMQEFDRLFAQAGN